MNKETIQQLKQKLELEKENLIKELESFAKKDKQNKDNWTTQAPMKDKGNIEEETEEAIELDNLISLEQNMEIRLKDVNLALEKIASENYGICEKCNKEIQQERLQVAPEARLCIYCNEK